MCEYGATALILIINYSFSVVQYCVLSFVFFRCILDIKFVGRTSRGHTGFLIRLPSAVRALIFIATFLSLVDREVEFSEKNPVYRDRTHVPTCQNVTRLLLSYRGDRYKFFIWYVRSTPVLLSRSRLYFVRSLKKNLNASKPSEHAPDGENMSKRLGRVIGCIDKGCEAYLVTLTDRCSFLLCFWSTRDHS